MLRTTMWILFGMMAACSGDVSGTDDKPEDAAQDGDADTDADTDTDADADTDADSDTDADTDTDSDSDTDSDTDSDADTDCYADYTLDFADPYYYAPGVIDVSGLDDYDDLLTDQLIHRDRDYDNSGTIDATEDYTYDAYGNIVLFSADDDLDGTPNFEQAQTWDSAGNLTQITTDGDAGLDAIWGTPDDNQVDGVIDYQIDYAYDPKTNFQTFWDEDSDADGYVDYSRYYTRQADGDIDLLEDDIDGDGYIDDEWTFIYDAQDRLILLEIDEGIDGVVDYRETTVYSDPYLNIGDTDVDLNGDTVPGPPAGTIGFQNDALDFLVYQSCTGLTLCGYPLLEYWFTWDTVNSLLLDQTIEVDLSGYGYVDPLIQLLTQTFDSSQRLTDVHLEQSLVPYGVLFSEDQAWAFSGACP